ncbi:hypothetical protein POM88_024024 [Heracleum sosnowskyi]|uniref:Uncharacterized protein n=1 Tax=Heracleum sosnowskyi TaxID=360622 RepID=A0AAD8II30_9APIA|nr:hypothetical protein POM88_023736 [Heracleum sosnowskyi]KAK1386289.1 hypothetical protein POM88_024024 [Heracleum sosnowskyi]
MWWKVPCTRRKRSLCNELRMDIENTLKTKLAPIIEEPEIFKVTGNVPTKHRPYAKTNRTKKIHSKDKLGSFFTPHQFSFKCSYVLFMTGFVSKHRLSGLQRYSQTLSLVLTSYMIPEFQQIMFAFEMFRLKAREMDD